MATGLVLIIVVCGLHLASSKEMDMKTTTLARLEELELTYSLLEKQLEDTRYGLEHLYNDTQNAKAQHTYSELGDPINSHVSAHVRDAIPRQFRYSTVQATRPVLFHSSLTSHFSVMSPHQIIVFNNVKTNIGGAYDPNFGAFKAPVNGLYEFITSVSAYNNYYVDVEMVVNNRMVCRAHAASPSMEVGTCVTMVTLTTGDDVFVRHFNGHGTYLYGENDFTSFSGHLISTMI